MSSEVALEVRGVRVGYGARDTLHGVTLNVPAGSFLGIVGPNGSGKSTLLKTMARALAPRIGAVLLDGRSVGEWNPREFAREAAVVSQEGTPAFDYTAIEVVRMGRAPYERRFSPDRDALRAVEGAMREVGVWDLRERRLSQLSGGERQLVRLARALAQEPEVLLLDEPTNNLDIRHQVEFMEALRRLNKVGKTVLMIVHDLNLAARYAGRVVVLCEGEIFAAGPPSVALDPKVIQAVFDAEVETSISPRTGALQIQPVGSKNARLPGKPLVHVICGGGSGTNVMRRLSEEGVPFSAGVLSAGDTDHAVARSLGAPVVEEESYAPISDAAHASNKAAASSAETVIICDAPVGIGNLRNLQAAAVAQESGVSVVLLRDGLPPCATKRDYTDGEATALFDEIVSRSANVVVADSVEEVVQFLFEKQTGQRGQHDPAGDPRESRYQAGTDIFER
ncbi:ABC transporter ATP-binding protein [soil metagenome]